jgi:ribosomal protein S18 acetylase RimI-like enzyme
MIPLHTDVALSNSQMLGAWRWYSAPCASASEHAGDGFTAVFCGLPIMFFNLVLLDKQFLDGSELKSRAKAAADWAATRKVPWMLAICHELAPRGELAQVAKNLGSLGYHPAMPLTGMAADRVEPPTRPAPNAELHQAADDNDCKAIVDINSAAYGMELDPGTGLLDKTAYWKRAFASVGFVESNAVTCAATLPIDGHNYVSWVATLPRNQRHGLGEAVMRHSLSLAQQATGVERTVLHATAAGRPVYARMGYRVIANYTLFVLSA